jgi:predicted transcriptional regulator
MPTAHQLLARHLRHPPAPRVAAEPTVVLSIKPHYADLIGRGEKRVEFRRRFPKDLTTARAIFYVSSPVRAIALTARVAAVRRGTPAALWRAFADAGATGRAAFDAYFAGAAAGAALVLEGVAVLTRPIPLNDRRLAAIGFRPPQSLAVLDGASPLAALIDRAAVARGAAPHLFA